MDVDRTGTNGLTTDVALCNFQNNDASVIGYSVVHVEITHDEADITHFQNELVRWDIISVILLKNLVGYHLLQVTMVVVNISKGVF